MFFIIFKRRLHGSAAVAGGIVMKKITVIACLLICCGIAASAQRITTVAGTGGVSGYSGDGGPATAAKLALPQAVTIDVHGNMYISVDGAYPNIRKVDTAGTISSIAGNPFVTRGFSGDGGAATAAQMDDPRGIAVDRKGNVYFFDRNNKRVRKVDTSGIITTFAGTGSPFSSGDGGPATAAGIGIGSGICLDSDGNIYIGADNYIRKVDTFGTITTIAGTGVPGYSGDGGIAATAQIATLNGQIALDKYGNLYVGSTRIRKISAAGIITTVAGNGTPTYSGDGGAATAAGMNVYGVYPDSIGNIYIADHDPAQRIRKVNTAGIITTIAGIGSASVAGCGYSGDGGAGTAAKLCRPRILCLGKNNCLYFAEYGNYCVRRLDLNDTVFVEVPGVVQHDEVISVYPNPAGDGVFKLRVTSVTNEPAQITITDAKGSIVQELTTTTNKETNIVLSAATGMYFVHVHTRTGKWVKQLLVE